MLHNIITKDVGRNYHTIPNNKLPIFYHPNTNVLSVSEVVVFKKCAEQEYDGADIALVNYIKDVRFATRDQIERAFPDLEWDDDYFQSLCDEYILNAIVLGDREDNEIFNRDDALIIYTLDIGGTYILNYAGINTNHWSIKESHQSARLIKRQLEQGELYLKVLANDSFEIRSFIPKRSFSVGRDFTEVDFSFSLLKNNQTVKNLIGYVVEEGVEDLNFTDSIIILNDIFNETQAWRKDYPISEKPTLFLIVYSKESLLKVVRILTTSTEFTPHDVNIIVYDQLIQSGLEDLHYFSFTKTEEGRVKLGHVKHHVFSD